jgi:hypothetical protein
MRVITLPGGRSVTLGEYVRSWRVLKTMPAGASVAGWDWHPVRAGDILREIAYGVMDRVNIRGGVTLGKDMPVSRINRKLRQTVRCSCKWCGQELPAYQPDHARFCEASCCQSFYS